MFYIRNEEIISQQTSTTESLTDCESMFEATKRQVYCRQVGDKNKKKTRRQAGRKQVQTKRTVS